MNEMKPKVATATLDSEKQKELFESGKGLYYYDGEKTTYCGYPATEDNPYDFAMSQQKEQKPVQSAEEKEFVRTIKSIIADFIRDKKPEDVGFYQQIYDWLDGRHIEQKPNIEICPHSIKSKSYSENPITPEMMDKAADECIWSQCDDNRFWIIDRAKKDILAKTNIESSPEEMKVLDSFLFRCWQMGWLSKYDVIVPEQKPVETSDFKTKLAEYMTKNRTGYSYSISSESILQMAKEELIKRGELQKPAEWSEEDEATRIEVIKLLSNPSLYEVCEHLREESVDWLKTLHTKVNVNSEKVSANSEKVNVNWSEEDEEMLKCVIMDVESAKENYLKSTTQVVRQGAILADKELTWLKSIRPRKLDASKLENFDPVEVLNKIKTEWPMAWEKVVGKQELSEEETKDLVHILKVLDDCYIYGKHDLSKTDYDNLTSTLKPLGSSWKPSEEHLSALLAVFNDPNNIGSATCQLALTDLYEHLKKL